MARKKRPDGWVEQAVVVKKTHPFAHTKEEAELVAERHAKHHAQTTVETPKAYRFITRPKTCFQKFRGQVRGAHVTVFWGQLKKGARRSSACR